MTQEIEFKDQLKVSHDVKISMETQTLILLFGSSLLLIYLLKRKK